MNGDPTQGDVVADLEALAVKIRDAFPDVIVVACPECGGAPINPAVVQTVAMIQQAMQRRLDALSTRTWKIAERERERKARAS